MSKLPPLPHWCEPGSPFAEQMQAYATAATEPLLQRIAHLEATASANYGRGHADAHSMLSERIAELEQRNSDLYEDVQRFKKHALNEKAARIELERQLEEARNQALEEAANGAEALAKKWWARHCETNRHMETTREAHEDFCQLGRAIRALKGAKE